MEVPMSGSGLVAFDESVVVNGASLAACLALQLKTPSRETPAPAPDRRKDDDVDGCDVAVEHATSDEDLPASEGGVA
jgi:hypothetical protein